MLTELANKYGTDKGDLFFEAHDYTPTYQKYITQHQNVQLLEIGINDPRFPGASLKMWDEYLTNDKSEIYGLDINTNLDMSDFSPRVKLLQADQSSPYQLVNAASFDRGWDYIIDDG